MEYKLKAMIADDISFNHTLLKCYFDELGIEGTDIEINGLEAYQKHMKLKKGNARISSLWTWICV